MRIRRRLGALPACFALIVPLAIPASASVSAIEAVSCSVDYTASDWGNGSGFSASLTLHNLGDPITSWSLTFTWPGNQRVDQGWNATWSQPQGSRNVTATSLSYYGNLGTNGTTQIGFNGSFSGTNTAPTAFAINGVNC